MSAVPARDLRNHTAEVLRRVQAGEEIDVLQNNRPVARLIPLRSRRRWVPATELVAALERIGPDTTELREQLRQDFPDTTDDLRW